MTPGQHRRRKEAFGASEMPMILALAGHHPIADLPTYMQERVKPMTRYDDTPRIYLEKANVVKPLAVGSAAGIGIERERELLDAWAMELALEQYAIPEETILSVESVRHASSVPHEWFPLRARRGRVSVTPDAWVRCQFGDLYDVELKCVTSDVHACRWIWIVQVQSQGLATGSCGSFVVAGSRWARVQRDDGPIVRAFVAPDEKMRRDIADASEEAWAHVESARSKYGRERWVE